MEKPWPVYLKELENLKTTQRRRAQIGALLAQMNDPRPGVGVQDGLPDIAWLPVAPGGTVRMTRHWYPETPDDEEKIFDLGQFPVTPFYIAKYPVTYAQYQAFVAAADGFDNPAWWADMPVTSQPLAEQHTQSPNNPRDSVSWYQSVAFARWLSHRLHGLELPHPGGDGVLRVGDNAQVRLPTECEWQWAAQNGAEAREYPWGEQQPGYCNTVESGLKRAVAVGLYPQGAAACGALDMAGNIMEWCANDKANLEMIDAASPASKVLRGGDWGWGIENVRCMYVDDDDPALIDILNGFRLVLG